MGKSGAGRLFSSSTLTRTFTRFTLTRMRLRCAAASSASVLLSLLFLLTGSGGDLSVAVVLALGLYFLAHGGRSESFCGAPTAGVTSTASATIIHLRSPRRDVHIR